MHAIIFTTTVILYALSLFIDISIIEYAVGLFALISLIISIKYTRGLYLYTGIVFLCVGLILFLRSGLPLPSLLLQFQSMMGLLSLFLVLPFMNVLIRVHRFDKIIEQLFKQKVVRWSDLYKRSSIGTQMMPHFINIATIPLFLKSLKSTLNTLPKSQADTFAGRSILRSYAIALSWSPMEVLVSVCVDLTGTQYIYIFPIMLALAFIAIWIDTKVNAIRYNTMNIQFTSSKRGNERVDFRKIGKLGLILIGFIVAASAVQLILQLSFLHSIVLLLPIYCIGWAFILGKYQRYFALLSGGWTGHGLSMSKYFFLFLSAGLMANMASDLEWVYDLQLFYGQFVSKPILFYMLTAVFFLILSFIGFHPLVAFTIFTVIIGPFVGQLEVIPFTIVLIASCTAPVMYAPFGMSVTLFSSELNINPMTAARYNIGFGIVFPLLAIALALIIQLF